MTISISRCRIREAFLTCSAAFGRSINKTNRKSPNWAQNSCFPKRTSRNNKKSNKNANKNEISNKKSWWFLFVQKNVPNTISSVPLTVGFCAGYDGCNWPHWSTPLYWRWENLEYIMYYTGCMYLDLNFKTITFIKYILVFTGFLVETLLTPAY